MRRPCAFFVFAWLLLLTACGSSAHNNASSAPTAALTPAESITASPTPTQASATLPPPATRSATATSAAEPTPPTTASPPPVTSRTATALPSPTIMPSPPPPPTPAPGSTNDQEGIQSAQPVGTLCPRGYPVKGDATARYHTAAEPDYAATTPVVCFATVEDATAAGYRPAHAG